VGAAGQPSQLLTIHGRNHFETGDDMGDPGSPIVDAVLRQIGVPSRGTAAVS
jgi:hypothetical protein